MAQDASNWGKPRFHGNQALRQEMVHGGTQKIRIRQDVNLIPMRFEIISAVSRLSDPVPQNAPLEDARDLSAKIAVGWRMRSIFQRSCLNH
jgi:hypothetical protein